MCLLLSNVCWALLIPLFSVPIGLQGSFLIFFCLICFYWFMFVGFVYVLRMFVGLQWLFFFPLLFCLFVFVYFCLWALCTCLLLVVFLFCFGLFLFVGFVYMLVGRCFPLLFCLFVFVYFWLWVLSIRYWPYPKPSWVQVSSLSWGVQPSTHTWYSPPDRDTLKDEDEDELDRDTAGREAGRKEERESQTLRWEEDREGRWWRKTEMNLW